MPFTQYHPDKPANALANGLRNSYLNALQDPPDHLHDQNSTTVSRSNTNQNCDRGSMVAQGLSGGLEGAPTHQKDGIQDLLSDMVQICEDGTEEEDW